MGFILSRWCYAELEIYKKCSSDCTLEHAQMETIDCIELQLLVINFLQYHGLEIFLKHVGNNILEVQLLSRIAMVSCLWFYSKA